MRTYMRKVVLFFLSLLLLGGCDLLPFQTAESIRAREEEKLEMAERTRLVPPADMLTSVKTIVRELKNEKGRVLARYEGAIPVFSAVGYQETACARMNEFYEGEFSEYNGDCEAFFASVREAYGPDWGLAEPEGVYSVSFTYELMDTPLRYICVKRTYTYAKPWGDGYVLYYPEIFLAENGWKLSFNGLFGLNAEDAVELVMEQIALWCDANNVPHERLDGLSIEDFWEDIAMTREALIIYVPSFTLSTNDKNSYEIKLDMKLFESKLTEPVDE
jgi:hypothetical protein